MGEPHPDAQKSTGGDRSGLKGDPRQPAKPQPKIGGWHWVEWGCEYAGTAFQLFVGFCVVAFMEAPGLPGRDAIGSAGLRLILIGVAFGLLAAVVALSPLGRRSGAHLNPAVTVGFWVDGHTSGGDVAGYVLAQVLGALTAAAGFHAALGHWAGKVHNAQTIPAASMPGWGAALVETGITFGLLSVIFAMVSHRRTARATPAVVTVALAGLIWIGAPLTGASMNPARTLGPDIVAAAFPSLWAYFVGPVAGAVLAAAVFRWLLPERRTLTAKLFHDERYPTTQRSDLPARPHPQQLRGSASQTST